MQGLKRHKGLRPRELRRRVILPARLRLGAQWSDACILNVSSRGMMIQTGQPTQPGTYVEIHRDRHVITARVMWRDRSKIGLQCEDWVPVDEILSLAASKCLRLVAEDGALVERRRNPRREGGDSRAHGKALQFAGVLAIIVALSVGGVMWVGETLARPLQAAEAVLGS